MDKGEVGIRSTIIFEAVTGERVSSHLELQNEGSTAIFYNWQQLLVPHSFPNLQSQTKRPCFYFNCSSGTSTQSDRHLLAPLFRFTMFTIIAMMCLSTRTQMCFSFCPCLPGVILPGDTQRVEFIFKSEMPGIKSELWQLNTHPVLMQGASMQVTLRGVALYQDKTADQRLFIQVWCHQCDPGFQVLFRTEAHMSSVCLCVCCVCTNRQSWKRK